MSWRSSQIESEERVLIYALWRILTRNTDRRIHIENLEKILTTILRLPVSADPFRDQTTKGSLAGLSLPEDEGIAHIEM